MALTDEQIDTEWRKHKDTLSGWDYGGTDVMYEGAFEEAAHAIESAACADRDARIAELEQRNRDLHEDVQRFKEHALSEKDARMALERELAEARKDAERWNMTVEIGKDVLRHPNNRKSPESVAACMAAINKGYDMTHAIDEAIDAAMKGQQ